MTDTTEPPNRPTSSRPRPFGRDGHTERGGDKPRGSDKPRGGDKPRGRSTSERPGRDAPRRDPAAKTRGAEPAPPKDDARIAKVMARAGLCSRRDAESWIAAGRVAVNGALIDSPALNVKSGDRITVDGQPLPDREQTRLFLFHKPRGLVTTARDPEGRPTIFDSLPDGLPRLVSVGRLDINTEGLMLLTNDGGLARVLELPATGWLRRYRVRANGEIDQARLDVLKAGVTLDGVDYAGIEATLDRVQGANAWLTMGLREGKNREIKRVLESLGLVVTRLIRISFGPFQLGELAEGAVEAVPTRVLREQLGPALAAQAGVDFEEREEAVSRRGVRGPDAVAPPRPSRSQAPAPRPHVSALRAARSEEAGEGRRRIERGATADRKGRAVKIERVMPVATEGKGRVATSRNARRFASEKESYVAGRQKTRGEAAGTRRGAVLRDRGAEAPPRPRRDGDATPVRGGFGDKPRGERAPSRSRIGGIDEAVRRERPPGRSRSGRAGDPTRGEHSAPGGLAGDADGRPRRVAPKAGAGKPNGRSGGFGSERPATGRNKPVTRPSRGRPAGGKPENSRPQDGKPPRGRS